MLTYLLKINIILIIIILFFLSFLQGFYAFKSGEICHLKESQSKIDVGLITISQDKKNTNNIIITLDGLIQLKEHFTAIGNDMFMSNNGVVYIIYDDVIKILTIRERLTGLTTDYIIECVREQK